LTSTLSCKNEPHLVTSVLGSLGSVPAGAADDGEHGCHESDAHSEPFLRGISVAGRGADRGLQLSLTAARVHSLREIPLGWQISVDNDASWNTEIRGAATVGAAALDAAFFNKLCFIETADASIPAFSAEATFIVTADFQAQRDIVVGTDNVIVAPR
jgi:hypothetical protein